MHVIELLFSAKPNSERLHQAALTVLLKQTHLLAKLTSRELRAHKVHWEPEGGATDLLVETISGEKIWIELKIDSILSRGQIAAQLNFNAAPDMLLYLLLGTSEIAHGARWGQWRSILGDRQPPAIVEASTLAQHITDALEPDTVTEVRDLADGYKRVLADLGHRTQEYRTKSIDQFKEHDYLGFFDALRTLEPFGATSTVAPVRAKGHHFVSCAWAGVPSLGLYLQFENRHLHLKLHSGDLDKKARKHLRKRFVDVALEKAKSENISLEQRKGRTGKNMTIAKFPFELTSSDPNDPKLLAAIREAHSLVLEIGKHLT